MLVPISWLKEYVDLKMPVRQLAERITLAGLEVEGIQHAGEWWDPETIVVGQVVAVRSHPNADRLVLVDVDYGAPQPEQVVTGAPNLFQYKDLEKLPALKVAFARTGAVLIDAYSDERPRPKKKLKPSKIRGIASTGMVCSERELGLSEEHEGILLLPEDAPVGKPLRDYYGDEILELGLTPDMARCLSMIGVAREVAALTNATLHLPADTVPTVPGSSADYVGVEIEDPELCNRYIGMLIKDVQIGESPGWMQERLTKAGMRPISNVVDITNYVMLEWGQPLHAFDYDLLVERAEQTGRSKPTIIVRRAKPGEKMKLHSEASQRFTKGVPATLNAIAARRAALLMQDYAGGAVVPGMVDNYPVPQAQRVVYTTESEVRRQLGMDVALPEIAASLQRLDITTEKLEGRPQGSPPHIHSTPAPTDLGNAVFGLHVEAGEPLLRCTAPWHRLDIQVPADLTEEVARVIGYEHIKTSLMDDVLPTQHRNLSLETEESIRDILVGCGLQETINYALTVPENHDKINRDPIGTAEQNTPFITLINPLSAKRRVMRRSMLVSALENLEYNYRYTQRMAVFEIGRVYLPEQGDGVRPYEESRLCILLVGPRRVCSVHPDPAGAEDFDFFV